MKHINYNTKKGSTVRGTVVKSIKNWLGSERCRAFLKWSFVAELIFLVGLGVAYCCILKDPMKPAPAPEVQITEKGIFKATNCGIDEIDDVRRRKSLFRYLATEEAPPFFEWLEHAKSISHKKRMQEIAAAAVRMADAVAANDMHYIAECCAYILAYQIADCEEADEICQLLLDGTIWAIAEDMSSRL